MEACKWRREDVIAPDDEFCSCESEEGRELLYLGLRLELKRARRAWTGFGVIGFWGLWNDDFRCL